MSNIKEFLFALMMSWGAYQLGVLARWRGFDYIARCCWKSWGFFTSCISRRGTVFQSVQVLTYSFEGPSHNGLLIVYFLNAARARAQEQTHSASVWISYKKKKKKKKRRIKALILLSSQGIAANHIRLCIGKHGPRGTWQINGPLRRFNRFNRIVNHFNRTVTVSTEIWIISTEF